MKKILAIDDQQDNLTTLKAVIKSQIPDCIVLTALSGAEGIDIAQKEQPDTILLDIIMPKMDGYEVCKRLKDNETTKHIPIIMITAIKTDIESRVKGLNLGADAFLSKPIDHIELSAQINVMLRIKEAEDRLRTDKKGLKEIVREQSFSLRESEEKYRALFENAPLPYQSLNEDGSFKDINPAWLSTLGYKKSEVIGKFYKDFLHPDWQEHFEKNFPAFKKRGYVSDVQFKIRHKKGHYLDISFEGCIGYYPDGSFRQTYCVFQDITERNFIEKTLQESEKNYRNLFDQSPAGSVIVGLDKRFVKCNKAFCDFLGYKESELIGKTIAEITHPDDVEIGMAEMKQIVEGKIKTVSLEKRYLHKNGSSLWGLVVISLVRDTTNKPLYFLPIIEDITKRKVAEKELIAAKEKIEESELKYRSLIENTNDVVFCVNEKGEYKFTNQVFAKTFGKTPDFFVGKNFWDIYPKEEADHRFAAVKEMFRTGEVQTIEVSVPLPDRTLYYLAKANPIKDETGKVILNLTTAIDITERKQAELELAESEERFKSLHNASFGGIAIHDKGIILECNQGLSEMTGYSLDELIGMDGLLLIANEHREMVMNKIVTGYEKPYEANGLRKNGERFPMQLEARNVPYKGKNVRTVEFRDITERKQLEEKIKENHALLRIAGEKSKLGGWNVILNENRSYWSDQVAAIHEMPAGYSPLLEDGINFYAPEWRERIKKVFTDCAQKGISYDEDMEIITSTGKRVWVRTIGEAVTDDKGNIYKVQGSFQDISERKQAEEKIREKDLQFRKLSANVPDLIFQFTRKPDGTYCVPVSSEGIKNIFGCSPEDVIDDFAPIARVIFPEDSERVIHDIEYSAAHLTYFTCEFRVQIPGKPIQWILSRSTPEKLPDGSITWYGFNADITERKLAELLIQEKTEEIATQNEELNQSNLKLIAAIKKAEESEERFTLAMKASNDGLFDWNLETNEIYYSLGWKKMLGYADHELPNDFSVWENNTEPEDVKKSWELQQKLISKQIDRFVYEFKMKHKEGHWLDILSRADAIFDDKGKAIRIVGTHTDITEQKLALKALKESEEKFRKAFMTSPDSININRLDDGAFVTINNGFTQIMGYTEEDVIGKTSTEFNIWRNPKDRKKLIEGLKAKGIVENLEAEFCAKNGDIKIGLLSATIIELDGTPHILSITRDTTIRKKAIEGIMHRESLLKTIFDSTADGLLVVDNKGVVTHKNSEFLKMWRIPANLHNSQDDDELIKTVLDQLIDPNQFVSKVKKLYNSKLSERDMLHFKDGRIFERKSQPLIIEDKIAGRVWSFSDISERKRSEQIQKVLYNISDTVTSSDNIEELIAKIKDHLSGIIDTTNYYIGLYDDRTKMISLPFVADEKDEIEAFPAENSLSGHVIKTHKSLLVNADQQEEMVKNGIIKFVGSRSQVWLGVPLTIDGEVKGVLAVQSYSDKNAYNESDRQLLEFVSDQIGLSIERKQKEQELIKALEKAKESDRLKSAFLATMSHELRTPLNAIIGFSDIIKEDLPIAEIIEFSQTIHSSGNHLLTIVEDLFDITLIETGELKIIKTDVNLDALLNEVKEIIKIEQLNLKKADLELNLAIPDSQKQLRVNTDPWRLKQIFINLLKNALKFTHKGSVNFGFEIESQDKFEVIKFFVKDTGIGIPKDKHELIFDVFRQIEDSHTRTYGGTGIGLSISRRLTELLGGRMWVDSDTNGSSFYFTIPLVEIDDQDKPDIKAESSSTSNDAVTLLIVEDDESSFEYLKVVLKKTAQFILWAPNGEEAVELCKNNPDIDLVLMDINMPVMNGYDATKAIKEFRPNLPIIAQTAYAIAGDREKSLAAGCDEYISKPIRREDLLDKIKKLLSS